MCVRNWIRIQFLGFRVARAGGGGAGGWSSLLRLMAFIAGKALFFCHLFLKALVYEDWYMHTPSFPFIRTSPLKLLTRELDTERRVKSI